MHIILTRYVPPVPARGIAEEFICVVIKNTYNIISSSVRNFPLVLFAGLTIFVLHIFFYI